METTGGSVLKSGRTGANKYGKDAAGNHRYRIVAAQRVMAATVGDGTGADRDLVRQHGTGAARHGPETARPHGGERVRLPRPGPVAAPLQRRRKARGPCRQPPAG